MIKQFTGPYFFLSNFYLSDQAVDNITYPSNEHFYQSQKTLDPALRVKIIIAETPGVAKKLGRQVECRSDWEKIKVKVMMKGLEAKFKNRVLARKLIATYPALLQEGNLWGDTFWGVNLYSGKGKNQLGKLLMLLRDQLKISY